MWLGVRGRKGLERSVGSIILTVLLLIVPILMVGETSTDTASVASAIMSVVLWVIPIFVLLMVVKLLFRSFQDISRCTKKVVYILAPLAFLGQTTTTSAWTTEIDVWSTVVTIVMTVLPFLVLIIVVRSIFRHFAREW